MNSRKGNLLIIAVGLMAVILLTAGCITSASPPDAGPADIPGTATSPFVPHVEIVHFYRNAPCPPCATIGDFTDRMVKEKFPTEIASGNLSLRHVNYDDPANKQIVSEFGVTGPSLWFAVYNSAGVHRVQDLDVWALTGNEEWFKTYLSGTIREMLNETNSS